VVCRSARAKADLLRIAKPEGSAICFDIDHSSEGRGAYLCPDKKCLAKAHKTDALSKALKKKVPETVYLALARHLASVSEDDSPEKLLGFALRSRTALLGSTAVEQGLKRGKVRLVVLDRSTAEATQDRMGRLCKALARPLRLWQGEKAVSDITGKANCRIIGITDASIALTLSRQLKSRI